jgi:hypothetical protein
MRHDKWKPVGIGLFDLIDSFGPDAGGTDSLEPKSPSPDSRDPNSLESDSRARDLPDR